MTTNTVELEPQERDQEIVQDCRVCCRPITLVCRTGRDGGIVLEVAREDG